jgi:hypothetical protein
MIVRADQITLPSPEGAQCGGGGRSPLQMGGSAGTTDPGGIGLPNSKKAHDLQVIGKVGF